MKMRKIKWKRRYTAF